MGEWRYSSIILDLGTRWNGKLHNPTAIPPGNRPRYSLDRKMDGSQRRSGRCGEAGNLAIAGNGTPSRPDRSYTD
jgi:hypothetical protein